MKKNAMNNAEIIEAVEKIVSPHFAFAMDDFYNRPIIESMHMLFFKYARKDRTLPKREEQKIVDDVMNLCVGLVECVTVPSYGKYIIIHPKNEKNERIITQVTHRRDGI